MNRAQIVYVVDDDAAVLDALTIMLETVGRRCETFSSPAAFLDRCNTALSGCLLLDIRMPGMSGMEIQKKLVADHIHLPVIFLTGHGDIPLAVEAMRNGAYDFVRKPFREQELLRIIDEALTLEFSERQKMLEHTGLMHRWNTLTEREKQVFKSIARGLPNKGVAAELEISDRTVEVHRARVMEKMEADSLAELVRMSMIVANTS